MPSNLENKGLSFNPVYIIRQQFKNDALLRGGLLDLKTPEEAKAAMQFGGIEDIGAFKTKTTRNQKIQDAEYEELKYNGRRMTWETRYKPLLIDKEWEITQAALNDPMAPVSKMLAAKVREDVYRTTLKNAAGPVMVGAAGSEGSEKSAADDGVIEIDGTAGWTRAKFQEIFETLYAQKYHLEDIRRAFAFISPTMNTKYLNIEQVMSRLYNSFNKNAVLTEKILDTINVEVVAGKGANVDWTEADEILPVADSVRKNIILMPDAMAAVVDSMKVWVNEDPTTNGGYVDSRVVVVEYKIGSVRKHGQRVLVLKEQMSA